MNALLALPKAYRGFSLVELLAVVSIVGLLATIALPLTEISKQRTKEEELRRALREIRGAIDAYKRFADQGRVPTSLDSTGYPPNLAVLTEGFVDARSPVAQKIFLLRRIPRDPFVADDVPAEKTWELRSYASSASQFKAGADVYDIRSRSTKTALNGDAYKDW